MVVSDPLDASSTLRRSLRCCCCSLRAHLTPPTPLSLSYIPRGRRLAPAASVVVSDSLDKLYIPCPRPTPPSSLPSPRSRLTLPSPSLLSSVPWSRKNTGNSAVRDIHSDALYLLLPQLMPPVLLLRPWAHLPLPTHPLWLPITQDIHRDEGASFVVPKYLIPWTHCILLVLHRQLHCHLWFHGPVSEILLIFGSLNFYLLWWKFAVVTVGRASIPNYVGENTVQNSWGANWIPRLFYKEYTILWFEFDLCG